MINKIEIYKDEVKKIIYVLAYNENKTLEYFLKEEISNNFQNEGIHLAKINSINKNNKTAFISLDNNQTGFINLNQKYNLQNGSLITCQVKWLGNHEKQIKLSDSIMFVGKYVIISYLTRDIHHKYVCNKIKHQQLSQIAEKYKSYAIIFRTSINQLHDINLVEIELNQLITRMQQCMEQEHKVSSITCLFKGTPLYIQLLRELNLPENLEVITNTETVFKQVESYMDLWQIDKLTLNTAFYPVITDIVTKLSTPVICYDDYSLELHILSGINLIDVNTQASKLSFYKVNYLSLDTIVYQIKLRDLTGIILIDLIKNMTTIEKNNITAKLELLLKSDWRKSKCLGFTNAGIFEIIRNK